VIAGVVSVHLSNDYKHRCRDLCTWKCSSEKDRHHSNDLPTVSPEQQLCVERIIYILRPQRRIDRQSALARVAFIRAASRAGLATAGHPSMGFHVPIS